VLADPDAVGDGGERRVDRSDAREDARVRDVEVVEFVGLAVQVHYRGGRVGAEPAGARLMGTPGERDVHAHVEVLVQHVVPGQADVVENLSELLVQPRGLGLVAIGVGKVDSTVPVDRDAVAGPGQVLGSEPEVDSVAGRLLQAPAGDELGQVRLLALHRASI
jgi:hypothetical protein